MANFALYAVTLALVGQTASQFYNPSVLFRGFGIPFAGFLRRFSSPSICDDPCKSTTCRPGSSCRVVQVRCFRPPCRLQPTCMAETYSGDDVLTNPCLINRPVMSTSGKELGTCLGEGSVSCPDGSTCTRALYGEGSKCCYAPLGCLHAKTATRRQTVYPVSRKSPRRHVSPSDAILEERHGIKPTHINKSLRRGIVVGPNRGGEAVASRTIPDTANKFNRLDPLPPFGTHHTHPGTCRSALHYRTCRNQCSDDSHCSVGKCCPTRCGTNICTYDRTGRYLG